MNTFPSCINANEIVFYYPYTIDWIAPIEVASQGFFTIEEWLLI